jgi:phytoene synthase
MNAAKITRQSKSNLALAFVALGRERKRDMTVFYAFCRTIDDIADVPGIDYAERKNRLTKWHQMVRQSIPDEPSLASDVRGLMAKYSLSPAMLDEIIAGVEMDLTITRYATFDALRLYCYRVASAVGLVSIEIFGCRNRQCKDYAIELGLALQMTNIIRDVCKDLSHDRIYLPQEDLARFGYSDADLQAHRYNEAFVQLMEFQAARARTFFQKAAALLPREERRALVSAEIMGSIYRGLLRKMELDQFQVFAKEYRLSKLEKASRIIIELLKMI